MTHYQQHQERLFSGIVKWVSIVIGLGVLANSYWFLSDFWGTLIQNSVSLLVIVAGWGCLRLARRGHLRAAVRIYLASVMALAALLTMLVSQLFILNGATTLYFFVLIATLVEPPRLALRWGGASVAVYVMALTARMLLPFAEFSLRGGDVVGLYVFPVVVLVAIAVLGRYTAGRLSTALAESETARGELERSHQALQTAYASLQAANQQLQRELAERARAEAQRDATLEALSKSQASLSEAQRIAHLGNWERDVATDELYWSDEVYRIFGLRPQEFRATREAFLERVHPDDREFVRHSVDTALYQGKPYNIEHRILLPDGSERVVHEQAQPTFDAAGMPLRMIGTVQDITQRVQTEQELKLYRDQLEELVKERTRELATAVEQLEQEMMARQQAEEAIRRAERRYRGLFEGAPLMYVTTRAKEGRPLIHDCNQMFLESLGYRREEVLGQPLENFYAPESRAQMLEESGYQAALSGQFVPQERHLVARDGRIITTLLQALPEFDADGQVSGTRAMFIDITERKRVEEALRESEDRYRQLFEAESDAIFLIDNETGRILEANSAASALYGYGREELLTKKNTDLSAEPEDTQRVTQVTPVIKDQVVTIPLRLHRKKDRTVFSVEITGRFFIRQGRPVHIAAIRDISQRVRAGAEREALIAELEAKNAELERFTYTVSHDLKSPLITIQGFLGFLEQDAKSGNLGRMQVDIARIADAARQMQGLLDELLELSRIGRITNPPEAVELGELVREALGTVAGRLAERDVVVQVAPDLPVVWGDRARLREVLENLVDNAAKFMGDQAEPRIEIGVRGEGEERVIYVRDNGMGIDPHYHEKVFDLFDKLDAHSEGSGAGLAIVQRIVELHGGRVWVESEGAGRGSTFCFTLAESTRAIRGQK